jgi:adenylosuccinate lyase
MTAYERFCTLVRLSAIDELNELQEGLSDSQVGSSSMPHKKNPIISENICGLARLVRSNLQLAFENCNLWFERDISHSSVERVMWPDTFHLVAHATKRMTKLITNLRINHLNIKSNLTAALLKGGASHKELLTEASQTTRFKAYQQIQNKYNGENCK